jgi:hypothetical protein
MPTVLTIVSPADEESAALAIENHGAYCARHGYAHRVVRFDHARARPMWDYYVLHSAKRALQSVPAGDLLMVATHECVVYRDIPLDRLMAGRDTLATLTRATPEDLPAQVQLNWLVLRHTPAGLAAISEAIVGTHRRVVYSPGWDGERAAAGLQPVAYYFQIDGVHLNINWQTDKEAWHNAVIFMMNTLPWTRQFLDGKYHEDVLADARFLRTVRREAHASFMGAGFPRPPAPAALPDAPYEAFQAESRIALVVLHTPEIAEYARVAEPNLRRYCAHQGYAMHAYRRVPEWLDPAVNGTWHKADLLLRHFDQHEWVIWVDSDILVLDARQRLEPLLAGRDVVVAKDIGGWPFNAGVMGFRHTQRNREAIEDVRRRIGQIGDKSSVYVNGSDQPLWIEGLFESGVCDESTVLDLLSINTPHMLAGPDSFLVHYLGLPNRYRALYMAADDAEAARRFGTW